MLSEKKSGTISRLINYLGSKNEDAQISDADKDYLERMQTLRSLVVRHSKARALRMYRKMFDVSTATAYRNYTEMEFVFGATQRTNKDFARELTLLQMDKMIEECRAAGDNKTAAYLLAKKFDWTTKEEIQAPFDPADIEAPVIIIGSFPEKFKNANLPKTEEGMMEMIQKFKKEKKVANAFDPIDHEEIRNELKEGPSE